MPKITVIIPTYNRAHLLSKTLESVRYQTRPPDEIIVINDGSTDNTESVLDGYGSHITVITVPNGGRSHARNLGMQMANGDFLCLLDDDDLLPSKSLAMRADYLEQHPNVGVVYGDTRIINEAGYPLMRSIPRANRNRPSGNVFAEIARDNLAPIHAHLFRRSLLVDVGYFDEGLRMGEDWEFWIRMAAICEFAYLPEHIADYRFHSKMTSQENRNWQAENSLHIQQRVLNMSAFHSLSPNSQSHIIARVASRHIRVGHISEARVAYKKAFQLHPTRLHYLITSGLLFVLGKPIGWGIQSLLFRNKRIK